ncbi:hypothetical protein [Brachyspira hampsonii]|uniref:Serpentine_recp domain containing protein n=1 Tax=Brachyspira hampsonii 30446 TaxID=1289135 RepID=A0A2U4EXP2_9SPIR|nr:hypothetical protein [Brachyspira hampsonii]EKV58055.1 hypothetical protein A966_02008 [Brachyspira hampsonii 30446]MBW5389571.1 hypothetical protein [Brachyspira hampsonii]MBW5395407.1 hypothetical protein [Brachyspira hampsonii]OEJ16749.1 hypothetical protein A9495_08645 [Brachyspira hampsonii]
MKKLKHLSLVIALILSANIKAFAASGFEASINVPLGASFGIPLNFEPSYNFLGSKSSITTQVGFDAGVQLRIGYMFDFGNFGLSLLGDLGYSYDSYRFLDYLNLSGNLISVNYERIQSMYMHNFQIGILPKFNFGNFSLGIGGGVKIPMAGTIENKVEDNINGNDISKSDYKSAYFELPIIGYVKMTFDHSFFFNDHFAFILGAYLGFDIGPVIKEEYTLFKDASISSFDLGIELGFKFGPRVGN